MKTAYFTAIKKIEIREEPKPELSGPEDVLLRIERVGICGSDIHYFVDGRIGDDWVPLPATLGHECAATVVECGTSVADLSPGDRVAVDPAVACGHCDQCRQGRANTCRNMNFMGCPGQGLGAAAEYRVFPAKNCIRIADSLTLDEAVLIEPISVGLYAMRLSQLRPGAKIAVLGCGPVGLGVLLAARATAGDCTVFATDLYDNRLTVARQFGAAWTRKAVKDNARAAASLEAAIMQEAREGLDFVFECSGDPSCIDQAQRLLVPGGMLVMIGITPQVHVEFDAHLMRRKELTFKNVRRQDACIRPVAELMAANRIHADAMLTHHFSLDRIQEAFETVAAYRDGVIKAVIDLT